MRTLAPLALILALLLPLPAAQQRQDVIKFGINIPLEPIRMAVADFRQGSRPNSAPTAPLAKVFDEVLWNDLDNAGLFELVSKSLYPKELPGRPDDLMGRPREGPFGKLAAWGAPPVEAQMLAFGTLSTSGNTLQVEGYLFDVKNTGSPMVLGKRYADQATEDAARTIAHRFANEIIGRLGGGVPGIAESKIYFVSSRTGSKEIWVMDYDGANQRPITRYQSLSLTPAVSPDGTKVAFTCYAAGNPDVYIHSLETGRRLTFRNQRGLNTTPAWSPDATKIAFCSSFTGDPEIYVGDTTGGNLVRLTYSRGVDISPVWNPKTGGQIAFVSDRAGLPQVYLTDADGSNVRRLTSGGGDAVTPAWSPNGQLLAFSWTRGFAPGNYNIFVMDVASGNLLQLTHGAGRNEHPSWAPDGRHIVFESDRGGPKQIYTMLADGTRVRALTSAGANTSPVWSAR